jgi:hypothetical protein
MKRKALAISLILALLTVTAVAVYAETASVTITGGSLSFTGDNVTLSEVTLDGTDQTSTSAYSANSWSASDARGTGAGWNVTIESTDFSDGTHTIDISESDQEFKIQLEASHITVVNGNTAPTSQVTSLTAIPTTGGSALKFLSAAVDAGMGVYTIQPNFELEVLAETYAGSYSATMTITESTGP